MHIDAFSKSYQDRTVLSFPGGDFQHGRIYALIGPNGSGKSTFACVVSGAYPSDQGKVVLENQKTGFLPQYPYVFHMSLWKNMLLNGEGTKKERAARARSLMNRLSLSSLCAKNAFTLSGGEKARMALARQFMRKYSFLILDEPCASMDIQSTYQAEALIREYMQENHPVLFLITHSLHQAGRLADEILFLKDGQLVERGDAGQMLEHPATLELQQFLKF